MEKEPISIKELQDLIKSKLEDPEVAQKTALAISNLLTAEPEIKQ